MRWLAAVRQPLEILTMAAVSPDVSDGQFAELVEEFSEGLPGLLGKMDHEALAELMEGSMGAAMANGITARNLKSQNSYAKEEKRAKLPWEADALLAGKSKGKGKQCGNSWIASWKRCGPDDGREWDEANAEDGAVLARLTGRAFKGGARILATPEGIRHAEKGHKHQLSENDWKNLRGRMFEQATQRAVVKSKSGEPSISFRFKRSADLMEAAFTVHFPHRKSPGELRIKTYVQRN